jgi:Tol biopolymer transport system component/beta-lactamase regulating signal transducer with metallopeptidase domain
MSEVITVLSDTIFVSLVNTTWQITLLIPLVALLIWVFRIKSAATRYSLWLFVLFAIIALPLITPFIPQIDMAQFRGQRIAGNRPDDLMRLGMGGGEAGELPEDGDSVPSVGTAKVHANRGSDASLINPVSIAYFIWCAGALLALCITLGAHINLRRLRVSSPDVKDPAALEMLSGLKQRVKVRRPVALKVSSRIYTPMSLGIFSPTIILPDGGFRGISELEMILTHELAHIRRCDYLVNILQNILKAIFFFHPLYHLMNRSLAKEREHICDDWVIEVTEQRSGYAECIIGLLERALHKPVNVPVTLSMAERKRDIPGRIDMIVNKKRNISTKVSTKALIAVFLIGCFALPIIGGIGLVRFAGARPASDEGQIVFKRWVGAKGCIFIMGADGGNQRQITTGSHNCPVWSPDGSRIAFHEYDPSRGTGTGIYVMDADGSNMKQLSSGPDDYHPTWSPDGKQIAFSREVWEQKDGGWNLKSGGIYIMNSDGTDLRRLTENFDRGPDWSPDGKRIAFHLYLITVNKPNQVHVMDVEGSNRRMLHSWSSCPAWSPDGTEIAFHSWRDGWNQWESSDIYVMNADGANVKRLTEPGPASEYDPSWSPDGAKIVFSSNRDGNFEIYVMDADGQNVQRLTNTSEDEFEPDWTAFSYAVEPAGKLKSTWGKIKALIRPH